MTQGDSFPATQSTIVDVLIVGAGPTGLTAAAEANRLGMSVRVIDKKDQRGSVVDSRALVVHPRVMELLKALGNGAVTKEIQKEAFEVKNVNFHLRSDPKKRQIVSIPLHKADLGDTEFKPSSWLPQYKTERILEHYLNGCGNHVEWSKGISSLEQLEEYTETMVLDKDGKEEIIRSRFVIGCDGGRSKTRELSGIAMNRTKTSYYLAVAEMNFSEPCLPTSDISIFMNKNGTSATFPLRDKNRFRVFILVPETHEESAITEEFVRRRFREISQVETDFEILHKVMFNISHGIADKYRNNRVFLAGDAAHVHSPLGGQGMNYGMQDAFNVVWKMAWVNRMQKERGSPTIDMAMNLILDSYEQERRTLGEALIQNTSRGSDVIMTQNVIVKQIRNFLIRNWAPYLIVERDNARGLAQLTTHYDASMSNLLDGKYHGHGFVAKPGDRLPNLRLVDGTRLYDHVSREHHTLVLLNMTNNASADVGDHKDLCPAMISSHDVDEHQEQRPSIPRNVFLKPQTLLVRPDLTVMTAANAWKPMEQQLATWLDSDVLKAL